MVEAKMTHDWDMAASIRSDLRELQTIVMTLLVGLSNDGKSTPEMPEIECDPIELHPFRSHSRTDGTKVTPEQRKLAKDEVNRLAAQLSNLSRLKDEKQIAAVITKMAKG